jgi:hypothetical protein
MTQRFSVRSQVNLIVAEKDYMRQIVTVRLFFYQYTGALRHYLFLASIIWWLFAVANVWWIIVFPTKGSLLFEYKRTIQIIQSAAAWGVPMVFVTLVFAVDGQYSQTVLFPYVCYPRTLTLQYYTYSLPSQFLVGTSGTLLIWTCYSLKQKVVSMHARGCHLSVCPSIAKNCVCR